MQQRRLRLGDTLDDYCPRERRVTNHAVVAMVDDEIKRTRCTTCDAEHEYKAARVPPRRKKPEAPGALYAKVLAGMPESQEIGEVSDTGEPTDAIDAAPAPTPDEAEAVDEAPANHVEEEGPVHRPLIRATLPRVEGPSARPLPEFTIRHPHGRDGNFRHGGRGRPGDTHGGARFSDVRQGRGGGRGPQHHAKPSPFSGPGGSRSPSQPRQSRRVHPRHGRKRSK